MAKGDTKTLIIATSRHTKGGITTVLQAHAQSAYWKNFRCRWIETHRDGNIFTKLAYAFRAFVTYLFILPQYDIVHIHTSEPPSALRKCPFLIYAKFWRKKTIIHIHSFSADTTVHSKYGFLYRFLAHYADTVVVLSEQMKKEFSGKNIPADKMTVIYNPCTTEVDDTRPTPQENIILFAGAIIDRKGYKDLIEAFALIADKYPEWKLVMAGDGEMEKAKTWAQQCGLHNNIIFPGWIVGEEKDRLFKQASIFCLPSYAEGFPMAVLDAWSYHLPVITTPVGGLPDVLQDKENALVFTPGDIKTLSQQIEQLITDTTLRNHIAEKSYKLAQTKFHIDIISNDIERLYNNI